MPADHTDAGPPKPYMTAQDDDPHVVHGDWRYFRQWVGERAMAGTKYLYRGQSNHNWQLQTSLHRLVTDVSMEKYELLIKLVYDEVATVADRAWDIETPSGMLSFLGFLQHHGFPTPLLDWTSSPYVAAYFAFEEVRESEPEPTHVSVYSFDSLGFHVGWERLPVLVSSPRHVSRVSASAIGNPTQLIQQGAFTLSNVNDIQEHMKTLEGRTALVNPNPPLYVVEYRMPVGDQPEAMRELASMGITHMSLFPGVHGICRALKNRWFVHPAGGDLVKALAAEARLDARTLGRLAAEAASSNPATDTSSVKADHAGSGGETGK